MAFLAPSAPRRLRVAIVGTGISGLAVAHRLHRDHDLTLFEAEAWIGGHTHTVDVEVGGRPVTVDTGFIVHNDRTYPGFQALLRELGVRARETSMSFSVRDDARGLEYASLGLRGLTADGRNLRRPAFYRMVADILRWNRTAPALLETPEDPTLTLGAYLARQRFSAPFVDHYVVPMGAAIWSTDARRMLSFPAAYFVRFLSHHGLLALRDRPTWRVIEGGSRVYVDALVAPFRDRLRLSTPVRAVRRLVDAVEVETERHGRERFDHVVLATHSDQALRLLADPSDAERDVLGAIRYQPNDVVLHTDASVMPRARSVWASWNYHMGVGDPGRVAVTYDMTRLQHLRAPAPVLVSLNHPGVDPARVLGSWVYHHPLYTPEARRAQLRRAEICGVRRTHFCGAYWGFGFHEDGFQSGLAVAERLEAAARFAEPEPELSAPAVAGPTP